MYIDYLNENLIYAGCTSGLFLSRNQGKKWQLIYQGDSEEETNCLSLIKLKDEELYLGTGAGLFRSQNNGRIWRRFSGRFGELPIQAMAVDRKNELVYLIASEEVYRIKPQGGVRRIFTFQSVDSEDADREIDYQMNNICIDPNKPQHIYLASSQGIFKSDDQGKSWRRFSDFGLFSRGVRFILVSEDSILCVVSDSGAFSYDKDRWQELTLRLPMQDIRDLTIDHSGRIYIAGDKGLFRGLGYLDNIYSRIGTKQEPTVGQVQQAAIKYAHVVNPGCIAAHRRLARIKTILPNFSLEYDKTISTYNNSTITRFSVGPREWSASLKWNLGDLIWSEQQRLIDSQARLMVRLRQDIIDEVTRLFFERRRLQLGLVSCRELKPKEKQEEEFRIEELTALLDGLTGGYFSKFGLTE